jgi:Protein of Unknown function (DUF2784)
VLVCLESIAGVMCPLTTLEDWLRRAAGQADYPGDFIAYSTHRVIFYDFPLWIFTLAYLLFGAAVVAAFLLVPPDRRETGSMAR